MIRNRRYSSADANNSNAQDDVVRKVSALLVILALLLPVSIPLPVFAVDRTNEPRPVLGLVQEKPVLATLAETMLGLPNLIATVIEKPSVTSESDPREKRNSSKRSNVDRIATPFSDVIEVEKGSSIPLSAVPVDKSGTTINGLSLTWEVEDCNVAKVATDQLTGTRVGETKISLKTEGYRKDFIVRVIPTEGNDRPLTEFFDDVPEELYRTYFSPQENLGTPTGQTEAQTMNAPAALNRALERPGSSSFGFNIPVASLSGRNSDAGIDISYNSRLWSEWRAPVGSFPPQYRYNQDADWLAPGFKMTLGRLQRLDYYNFSLSSPNGTRHQLHYVSGNNYARSYESADGTFVRLDITANGSQVDNNVLVKHTDGSKTIYTRLQSGSNFFYPTKLTDRHGNITQIAYAGSNGRLSYIKDTLNRFINFHYEGDKLVAVTVPGIGTDGPRQTIRFYYDTLTFDTTTQRFTGTISEHTVPPSARVLKYVYFPGNKTGYRYDYSPAWGMIYKVSSLRNMTVNSTSLNSTGSVTNDGEIAATTEYNYPLTLSSPLTDVPAYTSRTDDWLGRTTAGSAPVTTYSVFRNTGNARTETRMTAPDGTITETWAKIAPQQWDDGLVTDTFLKTKPPLADIIWSHTKTFWENQPAAPGRKNIRIEKIESTNDAGQTRATTFDYDSYNNQTEIAEHDFADPGVLGAELRRTEINYQTASNWVNRRLVNLPLSVKTFVGSTVISRTDYEYDGETLVDYGSTPITQHDSSYNSGTPAGQECYEECPTECLNGEFLMACNCTPVEVCNPVPMYDVSTLYRGNLTKVTAFADPTNGSDPKKTETTMKYDVVGNLIETGADCCKQREWEYSNSNYYAWPIKQKDGDTGQLETLFSYDLNTGLLLSTTDANMQSTAFSYDEETLRQTRVDAPNGAWAETEYNDTVFPYHVKSTSSLDATRSVSAWSFYNGVGQGFRSRSQTGAGYISDDVEYDNMGRTIKTFSPYTVTSLNDGRPGGIKFSAVTLLDGLGRVLQTTLQDSTTISNEYSGLVVTITDQAGKKRRQIADPLGRIVRVDEPNSNGELGTAASPHQPTYYEYDGNDNLTKVTQSDGTNTQERVFKYDGLSRLTHEKQVEAIATLNTSGTHVGSGTWTGVYNYDTDNLLIEAFDARGVKSTFSYDGLNRVESVTYTADSGYLTPQVTYTYDETETGFYNKGRLTKVQTAAVSLGGQQTPATVQNYRYNSVGQVAEHTQSIGSESYLQEYSYNLAGQLIAQKYPSGRIVENEIDNFGRLAEVSDGQRTYVTGLTYNAQGLLSQIDFGNGTHETYSFNDRFQMTAQSLIKGSDVLQKYEYGYGKTDVVIGTVDTMKNNGQLGKIESFIGANMQSSQRFAYDHLGRLKEAREHRGENNSSLTYKQVFDFDRFGNLYRKAASNPTTGQDSPLPFTPIEEATSPGTGDIDKMTNRFRTGTTYDDAGLVVSDSKFRDMGFSYDANGRQVKSTKTNQPDAWTVYDALGNRVATKINDIWQLMVYDAFGKLVAEYGVPAESLGGVKYVQQDWQGSVRTVTNSNGFVVARTDHQAFGEDIGVGVGLRTVEQGYSADKATRQGYGLTENDSATGQQHTWFRKLEPQAGRWSSPDPYNGSMSVGDPRTFNRYAYVEGDPVNGIDPSGLCTVVSGPNGPTLGPDCYVTIRGSSPALSGGGGSVGGTIDGLTPYAATRCYGSTCGGGGGGSSNLRGTPNEDRKNQQRRAEACARAKIRAARQQAFRDAAKAQVVAAWSGLTVVGARLGGPTGWVAAAVSSAYASVEIRDVGNRIFSFRIFEAIAACEKENPLSVLGVGTVTRLALSTTW